MKKETEAEGGEVGDDLRSQELTFQVPSALAGLTAGFEKGPGVPPPHETPTHTATLPQKCIRRQTRSAEVTPGRKGLGNTAVEEKPSTISTAKLNPSRGLHQPPVKRVVYPRSYLLDAVRELILGRASYLDAFSSYPIRR